MFRRASTSGHMEFLNQFRLCSAAAALHPPFDKFFDKKARKMRPVSEWKWKRHNCTDLVDLRTDLAFNEPDISELLPAEKAFLYADVKWGKESDQKRGEPWEYECDIQKAVNEARLETLRTNFGVDPRNVGLKLSKEGLLVPTAKEGTPEYFKQKAHKADIRDLEDGIAWNRSGSDQLLASSVYDDVRRVLRALSNAKGEAVKKTGVVEARVDALCWTLLQLSGFHSSTSKGGFELTGIENREFKFGNMMVSALPDAVVVQAPQNKIVLIAEDKAGKWKGNDGHLAQIFGECLCVLSQNFEKDPPPSDDATGHIYAIRLLNDCASFFKMEASLGQVKSCATAKLTERYEKMILHCDIDKPTGPGRGRKVSDQSKGRSLSAKDSRETVVKRLAAIRRELLADVTTH